MIHIGLFGYKKSCISQILRQSNTYSTKYMASHMFQVVNKLLISIFCNYDISSAKICRLRFYYKRIQMPTNKISISRCELSFSYTHRHHGQYTYTRVVPIHVSIPDEESRD